ncbi:AAA family ATPase [Frankia sp. AgB1.8]|uniref:nucleotide-binding protein n=1 Tax=Frankia sp. AgB1.8 TaxID=2792839 RepID=UPI001EE4E8C1|nr:AAA family ATPase [Frankia sp. AgB1.8]
MPNGWSVGAPEHPATRLAALTSAPPTPGGPLPGAGGPPPGPPAAVGVGQPADHRQNGYPGGRPAAAPGSPASWDPLAPAVARPPAELAPARLPMDPFATRAAAPPAPGGQDSFGPTGRPGPDPFGRDGRTGSDPFGPTGGHRAAPAGAQAPNGAANPAHVAAPGPNDPFGVTGYGAAPAATASMPADPWSTANTAWAPPPAPAHPSWLSTGLSVENPNAPAPTVGQRGTPTVVAGPGSGPDRTGGHPGAAGPPAGRSPSGGAQRPGDPFVLGGPSQPRPVAAGINVDGGPVSGRGPTGTNGPGGPANGFLINGHSPHAGNGQLTAAGGQGNGHPTRNGPAFPQGAGPGGAPANGSHLGAGIAVGGGPGPDRPGAAPAGPWIVEGSADQRSAGGQHAPSGQRLPAGQQAQSGQHLAAGQRFATGQYLAAGQQQVGQPRPGVDPRGAGQPAGVQPQASVGPPTQAFDPLFGDLPFGPGAAPNDAFPGGLTGQRPAGGPGGLLSGPGGPHMPPGAPGGPTAGPSGPRPAAPGAAGPGYPARPPMPPPGAPGSPMTAGAPTAFAPLHDRQPGFQPSTQFPAPAPSPVPDPPGGRGPRRMAPPDGRAPRRPRRPAAPPGFGDPRRAAHAYLPTSPDPVGRSEAARGQAPPARPRPGRDDLDLFDVSSAPSAIQPAGPPPPPRRRNTSSDPGRSGLDISGPGLAGGRSNGRHATGHPNAALYSDALLGPAQETAARGWRKVVYQVSGGAVNPGPSPDEARHNRLLGHIRTPLTDCHRIAVMSLKGGVGKTTTTIGLGSTLADLRDDRVVAIDANPDRGTLGTKAQQPSPFTVRDLLEDSHRLSRYVDIRNYMARSDSRLDVLASADDPEISEAFADSDYHAVDDLLQRYYSILLTDCGTGMLHSAMGGVLALVDTLVIVTSSSADGGTSASATLDWLDAHGYAAQVRDAVAVISMFPQNGDDVDVDALEAHFAARTRRVVRVPWDPHLATGGRISLHALKRETRRAYQELAAAVAERFAPPELDDLSYPGVNPYRDDRLFS